MAQLAASRAGFQFRFVWPPNLWLLTTHTAHTGKKEYLFFSTANCNFSPCSRSGPAVGEWRAHCWDVHIHTDLNARGWESTFRDCHHNVEPHRQSFCSKEQDGSPDRKYSFPFAVLCGCFRIWITITKIETRLRKKNCKPHGPHKRGKVDFRHSLMQDLTLVTRPKISLATSCPCFLCVGYILETASLHGGRSGLNDGTPKNRSHANPWNLWMTPFMVKCYLQI